MYRKFLYKKKIRLCLWFGFGYHKLVAKPQKTLHVPSKGSAVHGVEARHRRRKAFTRELRAFGLEARTRGTSASLVVI